MKGRGQVSSGITWFMAFVIIFFIMTLFIAGGLVIIAGKEFPIFGEGRGSIGIKGKRNFIDVQNLMAFLNKEVDLSGNKITIRELAFEVKNGKIEKKILKEKMEKFINDLNPEVYIFRVDEIKVMNNPLQIMNLASECGGGYRNKGRQESVLERGVSVFIFSGGEKINFRFYGGECP